MSRAGADMLYSVDSKRYMSLVRPREPPVCFVCMRPLGAATQNYVAACKHTFHLKCVQSKQPRRVRGASEEVVCPVCVAEPPPAAASAAAHGPDSLPESDDRSLHDALQRVQCATTVLYRQRAPSEGWETDDLTQRLFVEQRLELAMQDDNFLRGLHMLSRMERAALDAPDAPDAEREMLTRPSYQFQLMCLVATLLSVGDDYARWEPMFVEWASVIINSPEARAEVERYGLTSTLCGGRYSNLLRSARPEP